jgi:hypothetical protein
MTRMPLERGLMVTIASPGNGLRKRSRLMADKLFTVPSEGIGSMVRRHKGATMADLDLALRDWLDLK